MRAQATTAGAGPGVLIEGIQEGSRRRDFDGGRGRGRRSFVGGRGKSKAEGTTYGFIVTNLTLGTEPNSLIAYALGLELRRPIMSNIGDSGGQLERER